MKEGEKISDIKEDAENIGHLVRVLKRHIEKLEEAYKKKNHVEFNLLKKQILQIQRKIHEISQKRH